MFGITKVFFVNSRVRWASYAGFTKTSSPMLLGSNGYINHPVKVGGRLIGYTRWF